MKILQVAAFPFPSPQGSQVYVRGMAKALGRLGHEVTVVCYAHGVGDPDPEYKVVRTRPIFGYKNMRAGPDFTKILLDFFLAKKLLTLDADIIHVHNYEAPFAGIISRLYNNIPMVYSAHNTMQEELPTYFQSDFLRQGAFWLGKSLDHIVPRLADHAIAIRPETVNKLYSFGCKRVSCVMPGIDVADITMCQPANIPPGIWLIYAGNVDAYQDMDVLLQAMGHLADVGLLIVSPNNLDQYQNLGLRNLLCVQTSDFNIVRSYLAAADIAVLPRSICSGFPIKLLNYLGFKLPVVAIEGSVDPIPGIVFAARGEPLGFADKISELIRDTGRRKRLGAEGREHVLKCFTWEAKAKHLENIYFETLSRQLR